MKLVTRAQWGARNPKRINKGTLSAVSTCHWNGPKITISGKTIWDHSKCAGLVRGIQNFHMDGQGWNDIAYNFIECPHGYTFIGRGLDTLNGANGTNEGNRTSHAVMCLAGEGNPFPDDEKRGFRDCVKYISENSSAPNKCIGHRDHKSTACPGDERYDWVRKDMPVVGDNRPSPKPPAPVPPASAAIIKKGSKMNTFLFRTTKSPHVWLVAGDLTEKHHVQKRSHLEGFQQLLSANGLSGDVCVLDEDAPISLAISKIPAVGPVPEGYVGRTR